jgi:membrane protease YdiL (CAAX protease family)
MTEPGGVSGLRRRLVAVFRGTTGLRAGWRILVFAVVFLIGANLSGFAVKQIPLVAGWLRSVRSGTPEPAGLIVQDGLAFAWALLAAWLTTRLDGRPLGDAGLPLRRRGARLLGLGVTFGVAEMGLAMLLIWLLGGFSVQAVALAGADLVLYAILWAIAMSVVALFEEFVFRGYLQSALSSGIGFWPAAALLSTLFGAVHLANSRESWVGAVNAAAFGLFACFALRRTGSLWFGVGFHAASNYTETFVFSVNDSGMGATGQLLRSSLHGPSWLTGGSVGPEASLADFAALALLFVVFRSRPPARS